MGDGSTQENAYTVSSLTAKLKALIEGGFAKIYVEAEISGWKRYPSGHCYFTLKDDGAQVSCVMFASAFERCRAKDGLKDGAKVVVYANASVYAPRGNYQLIVLAAKLSGEGDLMRRYLELKEKLAAEGVFDPSRKRPLPFLPRHIGIVTSEAGAVIHDMCTVLQRRFPAVEIRLFPALVQGAEAPPTLIAGLLYFERLATDPNAAWRPDLVILARGGGSFEDLFCFNDEKLVRTLAALSVPTISAVGHETDTTLCDFAADRRAGTPSIAAEIAVPVLSELEFQLEQASDKLAAALRSRSDFFAQRLDHLEMSLAALLRMAGERVARRVDRAAQALPFALVSALAVPERRLAELAPRLKPALDLRLQSAAARLEKAEAKLAAYSPYGVLERGYSLTTTAAGDVVRDAAALQSGEEIVTRFHAGSVHSVVK